MNLITSATRRTLSALAATGFIAIATAIPASAVTDPGPPVTSPSQTSSTTVREVPVDDGPEYLQIGAGVLAGMAVAAAGVSAYGRSRRQHLNALGPA